ncbi:MAG: hypothetical protein VB081_00015 [Christensenella sp.]|uniref:hypothetical protein n=1 Tax=Christensenella sp. TaxID=1935934 RepID=UPI002B20EA15|nr:hypothetical protein [Christensenella sp.]MEA5001871.1 hypothetical protein [Christensenella sp.]
MKHCEPKTCLYGSETVRKDHPQIMLRGELDSLLADAVYTLALARERGEREAENDLKDIVGVIRQVMRAEACAIAPTFDHIIGLTFDELREYSYHPQKYLHTEHVFPDENSDLICAVLNILRTKVRQAERVCIAAGLDAYANESIQMILNRLSSAVYIIMLKHNMK